MLINNLTIVQTFCEETPGYNLTIYGRKDTKDWKDY